MKSMDLYVKHFGHVPQVNTNHPNIEAFLSELKVLCKQEAKNPPADVATQEDPLLNNLKNC